MPAKSIFPAKACEVCGTSFKVRSSRGLARQRFCSRACLGRQCGQKLAASGRLAKFLVKPKGTKDVFEVRVCECCRSDYRPTSSKQRWCRVCCPGASWKGRLLRYGFSKPMWDSMLESQGGLCAICKDRPPVFVDHCHDSGRVRGLLCCSCNTKLAGLDDSAWREKAEVYRSR